MLNVRLPLCVLFFSALQYSAQAQCPDCDPDTTCGQGTGFPTMCPEVLPNGTTGEYYEQAVTFFMPEEVDFQGITADLNEIAISSITGIPFGLELTVNDEDDTFYPGQGENYGCATLCGVPLQDGNFDITISAAVTASALGSEQVLTQDFIIPLTILEGELSNTSFSFSDATGCGELQVDFEALIDGTPNPTEYNWDFGNGNLSDQASPSSQAYSEGTYTATLETTIYEFILTQVIVNSLDDSGTNDIDELFGLSNQDPYLVVVNDQGVAVYTSESQDGSESATFTGLSIVLSNPGYSIQIWDSDTLTEDDLLGEYDLGDLAAGSFSFSDGGTQGSLVVQQQVSAQFTDSQEISVFEIPNAQFQYDEAQNLLFYDDESLISFTWFLNGDTIPSLGSEVILNSYGVYQCIVTSEFGCQSTSQEFVVCPEIGIDVNYDDETLNTSSGFESYEWFFNGLPIADANSESVPYQGAGNYGVTITTSYGCEVSSEVLTIDLSVSELGLIETLVYPNPAADVLTIELHAASEVTSIQIFDSTGKLILEKTGRLESGVVTMDVSHISTGSYVLVCNAQSGISSRQVFQKQ